MVPDTHVLIEPMRKRHVRAIRTIDKQVYTKPWSATMYHDELRQRDHRVYYVAHHNDRLAGYGGAMIVTTKDTSPRLLSHHTLRD